MITKEEFLKRIQNKFVVQPNGCHYWTGAKTGGYGVVTINSETHLVHRWVLFFKNGKWPNTTDHLCSNKACINEAHLEDVTSSENAIRYHSTKQVKTHCKHGHPLTPGNYKLRKSGSKRCIVCRDACNARR